MNEDKNWTSEKIRETFIEYFKNLKGWEHEPVQSSSLVPAEDPTLLFTNAGMVQFKDYFLGKEQRSYKRAVTCQRCLRAGGKHNDLENVGYTKRHHTFFEMLGNFSFGDYFKHEAIRFAWDFLTKELEIPAEKLWITVHEKDQEAANIWLEEMGVSAERFSRCGDKDNFWAMGETGPCGFCSEIFYDHGAQLAGNPPGIGDEDAGERYVEIWNLVFMEFERDAQGNLTRLPNPSIDTGMGLERIAAVMQGVDDNYQTDVFKTLGKYFFHYIRNKEIDRFNETLKNISFRDDGSLVFHNEESKLAFRVICDHLRAAVFLIADGILPSNEGRGYVLRKIIRRAVRFLYKIGFLTPHLGDFYGNYKDMYLSPGVKLNEALFFDHYPELELKKNQIATVLKNEEILFLNTLSRGIEIFEGIVKDLKNTTITGAQAFLLYDTYGFPLEITKEMAKERGLAVDEIGFSHELEKQRQRSKSAGKFKAGEEIKLAANFVTKFIGYDQLSHNDSKILALYKKDGTEAEYLQANEEGIVILDVTPFYAESGGQVGDTGMLMLAEENHSATIFEVTDTRKQGSVFLHYGMVREGMLKVTQKIKVEVDSDRRQAIKLNHSAAHLLHKALHQVIGEHATQRGSMVDAKRLRLDFAHSSGLLDVEIIEVERIVNQQIRANLKVITEIKSLDEAKKEGVIALFGEKYGEVVRVVKMGEFSHELCGGTHIGYSGEIGLFKIVAETGIAAGVRRIEAVTGENALEWIEQDAKNIDKISIALKVDREHVLNKIEQLQSSVRQLEGELGAAKVKLAAQQSIGLVSKALDINGIKILVEKVDSEDNNFLRKSIDQLKQQLQSAVILLATVQNDKISLVAGVTKDCVGKISANEIIKFIAPLIDGSGGGRPDMAQGGGTKVSGLDEALKATMEWAKKVIL